MNQIRKTEFAALGIKTHSYLIDHNDEDKKAKGTKKFVVKTKLKFEDYKHCLEATQLENKINNLEKNTLNVDNYRKNHKEFIKNKELILKSQQRSKSKKRKVLLKKLTRFH